MADGSCALAADWPFHSFQFNVVHNVTVDMFMLMDFDNLNVLIKLGFIKFMQDKGLTV